MSAPYLLQDSRTNMLAIPFANYDGGYGQPPQTFPWVAYERLRPTKQMSAANRTLVLLWRRGSNVLTASQLMVTRDERIRLVNGYNLEISELEPQDAGDYVCQISDKVNKDQVHTVEILATMATMAASHSLGALFMANEKENKTSSELVIGVGNPAREGPVDLLNSTYAHEFRGA
ncbi:hypothetical protein AND_004681 [Anopheles darlingi]|uniref:Uncharacterized protein n=1 Tax=Anopheles darlingi TaxID=43151 RepID=W5JJW4_ANODA|nr:hypothetical protein AND_004681 [Anopheles darlingi]